jgi:hypothetical protein
LESLPSHALGEIGGAVEFAQFADRELLETFILKNLPAFLQRGGVVLYLYSLVHTRGIDQVSRCGQELIEIGLSGLFFRFHFIMFFVWFYVIFVCAELFISPSSLRRSRRMWRMMAASSP